MDSAYIHTIQAPVDFDLQKMQQVYDNYTVNYHAGLTLVMGHPFADKAFQKKISKEQEAIKKVFAQYGLEDYLVLYDVQSQIHATLIELASQHNKEKNDQKLLDEEEVAVSDKTKSLMNINYAISWIKKIQPFEIELGPNILSDQNRDQTLRITETGQIVMKGRPKDRKLLARIRAEFEQEAGVIHKYGKDDDEFFFVIGYLKPNPALLNSDFRQALQTHIHARRPHIQLSLKVDAVKIIMYNNYSLDKGACLWESQELKFLQEPILPQKNLTDSIKQIIQEIQSNEQQISNKVAS
jgi:hypothetical protein